APWNSPPGSPCGGNKAWPTHIAGKRKIGIACPRLRGGRTQSTPPRQDHVPASFHQIGRMCREPLSGHAVTSRIDYEVLAVDKAEPPQFVEHREMMRRVAWTGVQAADAISPPGFLRARRERPCRRPAEKRDECPPPHSITSSAARSSVCGIVSPSDLAVLRLMTSSNLVGCKTGRSAGWAPLRILPA